MRTVLEWLRKGRKKILVYIRSNWILKISGKNVDPTFAAYFSTLFDVGGILGGILAGLATDLTGKSATTCAVMLIGAIPMVNRRYLTYS